MADKCKDLPKLPGLSAAMSSAVYSAVYSGRHLANYNSKTVAALVRRGYLTQEPGIAYYSYPTDKARAAVKAAMLGE